MKKIVASVGMVALGASTLHAAYTQGLSELETKKPWSVGMTLRGFYDDNIESAHSDELDSTGFEVNPWVGFHWIGDQTMVGATYAYSGKYYEETRNGSLDHWSHSHIFDAMLQHAFSPRLNITARDSFIIGQEPDLLRSGDTITGFVRVEGDNIRNYGNAILNAQLTKVFGISVSYANSFWDYDDSGARLSAPFVANINGTNNIVRTVDASWSGLLDRMEHAPQIDGRWQLSPQTVGLLGYRYRDVKFTGDEAVSGYYNLSLGTANVLPSDSRNYRSHYGYAGVEHNFSPSLFGQIRAGVNYTDNYNDPNDTTGLGPYLTASLTWEYTADTTLGVGVSQDFSTTDVIGTVDDFVRGVNTSVGYLWFRHRLAPSLYLAGQATVQYSTFDGGGSNYDGKHDFFFLGNLTLEYQFNKHISGHIGYNYDNLSSEIDGRDFDRNRVYIGLSATY